MKLRVLKGLLVGLFLCSFVVGCDGLQSLVFEADVSLQTKELPQEAVRENPYQIGLEWDREVLGDMDTASRQIFQLYRYGMGAVGVGTYIGEVEGKHVAMTTAHTYKELSSCSEEVSFIAKSKNFDLYFECSGWSFQLKDSDILFFEITSPDEGAFDSLSPTAFSKKSLKAKSQLRLVTIERRMPDFNFVWFVDDSSDCILLRAKTRYLQDPDNGVRGGNNSHKRSSWSLPIGCDGQHGDSGAPIFDEDMALVGLLWTGKYPKTEVSANLNFLSESSVWRNFNYMVPFVEVARELGKVVGSEFYLSLETRNTLRGIKKLIDTDQEDEYLGF